MGKKVTLSKKQLSTILQAYSLGDLRDYKYFSKGQAHTNIFLEMSKGKFVLKVLSDRDRRAVRTDCEAVKFLGENGFPTIKLIPTIDDALFLSFENTYCFIYEYVAGQQINNPCAQQLKAVAKTLAQLHLLSPAYSKRSAQSRISKKSCFDAAKTSAMNVDKNLARNRLQWVRYELAQLTFPSNLAKSLLHRDFSQENILFKKNKLVAVLDMDALGKGACVHDVASLIYFWAWFKEPKRKLNMPLARKLVAIYETQRTLSPIEKKRLYDALVLRCLIYVAWELAETSYQKELKTNYYEFFKSLAMQVISLSREGFYQELFL